MSMTTARAPLVCTSDLSALCSHPSAEWEPIITTFLLPVAPLIVFSSPCRQLRFSESW